MAEIILDGVDGLLHVENTPAEAFRAAVEQLLRMTEGAPKPYRDAISAWILSESRLGHPVRVRTRGNWVGISERSKRLAVQLYAARDLKVFFDVLIGSADDAQERRPFWEQYAYSPQLVDFAIACDPVDKARILASHGSQVADVAWLENAPEGHSAFIMQFEGAERITVAEISKANNAMYLFSTVDFEARVGSLQRRKFSMKKLKDQSVERYTHRGEWHSRFAGVLRQYRVYPGRP